MSRQIWKFPIALTEQQEIQMPVGARILCIQVQGKFPCMWAVVDPMAAREHRTFQVVGTGNPVAEEVLRNYVGTWQWEGYVWHLFEVTP